MSTHSGKADFALHVKDSSGKPVSNFRWILEEDNTGITTPGQPRMDSPSLKMHKSHAPLMSGFPFGSGAAAVATSRSLSKPHVQVVMDREAMARPGVRAAAALEAIELWILRKSMQP
jgi:hypothetical protein